MDVKLVINGGTDAGKAIPVAGPKWFIGRADDCHFRPENDSVSRHHCVVIVEDDFVAVRDLGSKLGTFVNGDRIVGARELKDGDRIRLGDLELEVRAGARGENGAGPPAPQAAPARAAGKTRDEDLDLDSWLNDADLRGPAGTQAPDADLAGEPEPESPETRKKDQHKPAEVVGVWKKGKWSPTSVDPGQAAADTLKNFFRRH